MNRKIRYLNAKLNSFEKFLRQDLLKSFPVDIGLPAGDKCNLNCIFCTERKSNSDYKNISFEEFLNFTEPLKFASFIQIQGWGEPLLNPDYEKIFDFVIEECGGARVSFSTNGILLNEKWIDKLTSNENIVISISLNASSKEGYHHLMGKDYFNKVIRNIKLLTKVKAEKGISSPFIAASFVCMNQNIHELPEFINLVADLGIKCVILRELMILRREQEKYALDNYSDKTNKSLQLALKIAKKRNVFLNTSTFPVSYYLQGNHRERVYSYPDFYPACTTRCYSECFDPWTSFAVNNEGYVKACCYSDVIMGNIFEQSFSQIWNGEAYRYYRKNVNTSNPPQDCAHCVKKR